MSTIAEANALRIENEKLEAKITLMRSLGTTANFYNFYFKKLLEFESNKDCFDHCNELFFDLFGVYRYSDYASFRVQLSRFNKPKS